MSWTHFLLWLGAAYALYYGLNLLYDRLKSPIGPSGTDADDTILFYTAEEPVLIPDEGHDAFIDEIPTPEQTDFLSSGSTGSLSAVSLEHIQELARQELIEYKKKIPY